jgi:hypothetical protein
LGGSRGWGQERGAGWKKNSRVAGERSWGGSKSRGREQGAGAGAKVSGGSKGWGMSKGCKRDRGDEPGVNVKCCGRSKFAGRSKELEWEQRLGVGLGWEQRLGVGARSWGGSKVWGREQGAGVVAKVEKREQGAGVEAKVGGGSKELGWKQKSGVEVRS